MKTEALSDQLTELMHVICSDAFGQSDGMRVASVQWTRRGVNVRFVMPDASRWELRFIDVLESRFTVVTECGLHVHDDNKHVAVLQYMDRRLQLHFAAKARDPFRVIGKLRAAHIDAVEDWIPFDRYLDTKVLTKKSGLLATGPAFLIKAYANVLKAEGCKPSMTEVSAPRVRGGVMAHFGESYVIAASVSVRRHNRV